MAFPASLLQERASFVQDICACYIENHVSPMLKIIQNSQELLKEKLEDNNIIMQGTIDALREEQRLLKLELGEFRAKSPDNYTTVQNAAAALTTLKQMQALTAKVYQKADASDVAGLTALVESEVGLSSSRCIKGLQVSTQVKSPPEMQRQDRIDAFEEGAMQPRMELFDKQDAGSAEKADSDHAALVVQVQGLRKELAAATASMARHKVEGSIARDSVEGNKTKAREEQVEPTEQDSSKPFSSHTLSSNLINAEQASERLLMDKDSEETQAYGSSSLIKGRCGMEQQRAPQPQLQPQTPPTRLSAVQSPALDSEITFLSDDSTQEPCSSVSCTQELYRDTGATMQPEVLQEPAAWKIERAQMQQAEPEARGAGVCISAQEEGDRLRDKLEEAQEARHHDRSCLTERISGDPLVQPSTADRISGVAWPQVRDPLCNAAQVEGPQVGMKAETPREAGLRAPPAKKDEALQQVEPVGQDASKRSLAKILQLKLTNAEEDNERLQQERTDLSRKFKLLREMTDTEESI